MLAHAANIVIDVYAVESVVARAEKLAKTNSDRGALAADVARVYASDAADRVAHAGKQIVNALGARLAQPETLTQAWTNIASHRGTDTVAARRRIGDAAIGAGRYPF